MRAHSYSRFDIYFNHISAEWVPWAVHMFWYSTAVTSARLFPYFVKFWQWQRFHFFRDNTIEILIDTEEQSDCQKHVPIIVDSVQQIIEFIYKLRIAVNSYAIWPLSSQPNTFQVLQFN